MVALTAQHFDDLGRVEITASGLIANVVYELQRSTDLEPTWVDVRGGQNISTTGVTAVNDYEYTPNITNYYRLTGPIFYDSFNRVTAPATTWGTADTGQVYAAFDVDANAYAYVNNGIGIIGDPNPVSDIIEMTAATDGVTTDAEITWSAIQPAASLDVSVEYNGGLRATLDNLNYYESQMVFTNTGDVNIRLLKMVAGVQTSITATLPAGTWTQNVRWFGKFRIVGSQLQYKTWEDGSQEPGAWQLDITDTSLPGGTGIHIRARKGSGAAYEQYFGPIAVHSVPETVVASASITPIQEEVWLKSVAYPLFNRELDCVDWDALSRSSRAGFFNIKGRHEILGITDVGSSASFELSFVTRSRAENRAVVALLTYGGVLLLQPPGDSDEDCQVGTFSGIPGGYVVPSGSVQNHSLHGQPIWQWTVNFTRVAAADSASIVPTTITWEQLWALIGDTGTWEDVWALWSTWQELWSTQGSIESFGSGVLG